MPFVFRKKTFKNYAFVAMFASFLGCSGISIKTNIYDNDTICIFTNIHNNHTRLFQKRIKEHKLISEFPNCKYIVFANLTDNYRSIQTITGLSSQNIINITASYTIFENDLQKQNQINEIIDNPSINDYAFWTGAQNAYSSRGTRTEGAERKHYSEGTKNVYNNTISRIKAITKQIGVGSKQGSIAYSANPILLTAETQSNSDALEQLAVSLADKVINSIIIDIEEYKDEETNNKKIKKTKNKTITKTTKLQNKKAEQIVNEKSK